MLTTAMIICAAVLAASVVMSGSGILQAAGFTYAHAEKYTAGDAEIDGTVKNLDINWINGKVELEYYSGKTIELHERSDKTISPDMQMRWWLDGDTLRVRFAKPGFHAFSVREKNLTILLPENSTFGEVSIAASSGDLQIPDLKTDSLKLTVSSGDIRAAADTGTAQVNASSGDLELQFGGKAKEINVKTSSGEIRLAAETAERLAAKSSSGEIEVRAKKVDEFTAEASSGDISADIGSVKQAALSTTSGRVETVFDSFDALSISSTSGDVRADLPEKPGFTAVIKARSGDIRYDLPLTKEGKTYVCGNGSGSLSISTTSGDITLR